MFEKIRKAKLDDVKHIQPLINYYANQGVMIARSFNELYDQLRDFWVYDHNGKVVACCALHVVGWQDLGEIKCLAVDENRKKKGIGTQLVQVCLEEAATLGVRRVFVLTYVPTFFNKLGFQYVDKAELPQKIWAECCNCPKFPDCKEISLVKNIV